MTHDPIITADDVVRAGACADGVQRVVKRLAGKIAAAMPLSAVLKLLPADDRHHALKAANFDGDGYGYGYGSGSGYGDGSGDGYGYGDGDGDGSGSGSGYGDGYGYGYGDGDGDGEDN